VSTATTGESTQILEPGLLDMARVIAEKFEASAQANLHEAGYWDREAEQYAHLPPYANWSRKYEEIFRRHAWEDQEVAKRNRRYMAQADAANGGSAG
jgi:hypothetical protein